MSFRVVLSGQALPGYTSEQIAQHLQTQLKFSATQVQALLPPARRVVKSGLDRSSAERWCRRLQQAGLAVVIEDVDATVVADPLTVLQELAKKGLKRARPSAAYALQLFLVTLCCLLVPVLYAGLVIGLGVGLAWYLTHIHEYLGGLRNIWLLLCIYGVPAISGGILLLFMARPFFLPSQRGDKPLQLDLASEPRLQQVIVQLCQAIGLRPPVAVELSNEVNASVHFENGWSGFFSGRKVLTIGMPLVAGMSVQQFVGVLGHEFGHFAQRLGMRCNFLVNSVNAWLEVRGNSRDPWDDRLQEWLDEDPWWILQLAIWAAQQGIELSRLLMRGCFWLSFRLSRSLSRQMEFDADRYESLLAGSAAFRGSALQLRSLFWAWGQVDQQNARTWRERRLLRDMPQATAEKTAAISKATLQQLEQGLEESDTRYWHTHPADLARIQHSEALRAPGYLHDARPAAVLFERFSEHCQRVTKAYYAELGLEYDEQQLQDSQQIFQISAQREEALDQLWEWTGRQWRNLPWLALHQPVQAAHAELGWQAVIDELRRLSPEITQAWTQAEAQEQQRVALAWCGELQRNGVTSRLSDNEAFDASKHLPLYRQIDAGQTPAQLQLLQAASLYRRRLELSLAGAVTAVRETARLALHMSKLYGDYARLLEARELAEHLLSAYQQNPDSLAERLSQDALSRYQDLALRLLKTTDQIPQTLLDGTTLGGYLRLRCPRLNAQAGEPVEFLRHSSELIDSLAYIHRRAMAELASYALQRERDQGLRGIRLVLNVKDVV
ncbi:MAG: M48 family metalloprotease [Pseudomonas sp.]|uniref:M48 family metallopeptidase n=1 Tax=Pseudomonas sp. TaxID=306 RepID=UPI00398276A6